MKRQVIGLGLFAGIALTAVGVVPCALGADDADEFVIKPQKVQATDDEDKSADKPKPRKCFRCHGSGKMTVNVKEACDRCEGTGILVTEVELKDSVPRTAVNVWGNSYGYTERSTRKSLNRQPCPRCKRQGKVSVKKDVECTTCKGAGWLLQGKPHFKDEP